MARKCDCPKPRRPPSRAQRAYAAARRDAISSCLGRSPGPGRAPLQPLQPSAKKKKGGGIASWLGQLQLAKTPSTGSWYDKQSISGGGSGGGYYAGEAYGGGKFDTGSIFDKLLKVKG